MSCSASPGRLGQRGRRDLLERRSPGDRGRLVRRRQHRGGRRRGDLSTGGVVEVRDAAIFYGEARDGGGIFVDGGSVTIEKTAILNNTSSGRGSAISVEGALVVSSVRASNVLIAGNDSTADGAVWITGASASFEMWNGTI